MHAGQASKPKACSGRKEERLGLGAEEERSGHRVAGGLGTAAQGSMCSSHHSLENSEQVFTT